MSVFADGYSRYLNYAFNFNRNFTYFNNLFTNTYTGVTSLLFLNQDFIKNMENNFPMFPNLFNVISGQDYVKLLNIYNSTLDNVDQLSESMVGSDIISSKLDYDKIPGAIDDIKNYSFFQYTYTTSLQDIYDSTSFFRSFTFEKEYRNFFQFLFSDNFIRLGEIESAGLEDSSFRGEYIIRNYLFTLLSLSINLSSQLIGYTQSLTGAGSLDKDQFKAGFSSFMTSYTNTMKEDIVNLVIKILYNFDNVASNIKTDLESLVEIRLGQLNTAFSDFLDTYTNFDCSYEFCSYGSDSLLSIMTVNLLSNIYNDNTIITQSEMTSLKTEEDDIFTEYMSKSSNENMQFYLFMCYMYKFWPNKFLNVLCLALKTYTQTVIKSEDDDYMSLNDYSNIINKFMDSLPIEDPDNPGEFLFPNSKLDYNALRQYLVDTVTLNPSNYLSTIETGYSVPRFASFLYCINMLDLFIKVEDYTTFVDNILSDIYEYLRDNGHVEPNFNWYDYNEVIRIYMKVFMRHKLLSNTSGDRLFENINTNFTNIFNKVVTNSTGDSQYDLTITFPNAFDMNSFYQNLYSGSNLERCRQFNENMFLSVLTREVIYGSLMYFIS